MVQDEDMFFLLSGGNQVKYGQVFGLATDVVVGCPGLKEDLRVRAYDFSRDRVFPNFPEAPSSIKKLLTSKITLKELESMIEDIKIKSPRPLEVYVFAKKKVSIIVTRDESAWFMGSVIIGDHSGICEMVMFNDAIESIFNCINQGDKIIINSGWTNGRTISPDHYGSFFNPNMGLMIEIKVNVFDARKIFVVKDTTKRILNTSFSSVISLLKAETMSEKLWTATDILHKDSDIMFKNYRKELEELKKNQEKGFDLEEESGDGHIVNFDVIGVIKHSGRLERRAKWNEPKSVDIEIKDRDPSLDDSCHPVTERRHFYQQYGVFRWLELIDLLKPEGEPVKLQIQINDMKMWNKQQTLIPGSLIVITHCTPRFTFLGKFIRSSQYSEIFSSTDEISDYLKRMPLSYVNDEIKQYFNCSPWKNILQVTKFTIGGAYCQRICHKEFFKDCKPHKETEKVINTLRFPRNPFVINQVQRIVFTGRIVNSYDMLSYLASCNSDTFRIKPCVTGFDKKGEPMSFAPLIKYDSFLRWSGCRQLPKISVEHLSSAKEIMTEISKQYGQYAESIFFLFTENIPHLATRDLDLSEKLELYVLEIENESKDWVYHAYWYGYLKSKEVMQNQLRDAEGKMVDVLIDIQKCHLPGSSKDCSLHEYEIIVHDFMVVE